MVTQPTAEAATGALVTAARSIDRLHAAAGASAQDVASLFSWRRIAQLHVERYGAAC